MLERLTRNACNLYRVIPRQHKTSLQRARKDSSFLRWFSRYIAVIPGCIMTIWLLCFVIASSITWEAALNNKLAARECSSYRELSSSDRSVDFYRLEERCDSELAPGWYRFNRTAGSRMNTKCVPMFQCGTSGPGWLVGEHPSVKDGMVERKVCFHTEGSCCSGTVRILVRNCSGYYVYRLSRVPCPFRFCGASVKGISKAFPAPQPKVPSNPQVSTHCYNYNILDSEDRASGYYNPFVSIGDHSLSTAWYRFQGSAGSKMATSCVPLFHCGTHSPGWLLGGHPTAPMKPSERTVCFHWLGNCCFYKRLISVVKCKGYFVYRLPKLTIKYLRYCGNTTKAI